MNSPFKENLAIGLVAAFLWGTYPFWYPLALLKISSLEFLTARIISSLLFSVIFLFILGKHKEFVIAISQFTKKTFAYTLLASFLLFMWWALFIYCVDNNNVLGSSFGYNLAPLFSIIYAHFLFKEPISGPRFTAITIMASSIIFLFIDHIYYEAKVIDFIIIIILGLCFSTYAIIKKLMPYMHPVIMSTVEFFMLGVSALFILPFNDFNSVEFDALCIFLIAILGLMTVLPLFLYSHASHHLPMFTTGSLQMIPPASGYFAGYFFLNESISSAELVAYISIVFACSLNIWASYTEEEKKKKEQV